MPAGAEQQSDKRKVLIQLDSDPQPSVFDRVVALDAGADEVLAYGAVTPENVREKVHGAIFTRGPRDLKRTALFVGGSDVAAGERLLAEAQRHMIPQAKLRVSVLLDSNGCNTTAAAAVRAAARHLDLKGAPALVLGATGPVGQRVVRLLAREGAEVRVGSRQKARSEAVCAAVRARVEGARLEPVATASPQELAEALSGRALVIAAGAAGAVLLPKAARLACPTLKVAIDLNAVPALGIEGVEAWDKAAQHDGVLCYGAIGVGDTKMKVHKAAVARLFESNDQVLDAEEVYALAQALP
jgi:methylenetetrahydrofolate/methylenetetrahydromethanopterin dehydrogenase (NADP+)